jgi:hypothetical protein
MNYQQKALLEKLPSVNQLKLCMILLDWIKLSIMKIVISNKVNLTKVLFQVKENKNQKDFNS